MIKYFQKGFATSYMLAIACSAFTACAAAASALREHRFLIEFYYLSFNSWFPLRAILLLPTSTLVVSYTGVLQTSETQHPSGTAGIISLPTHTCTSVALNIFLHPQLTLDHQSSCH